MIAMIAACAQAEMPDAESIRAVWLALTGEPRSDSRTVPKDQQMTSDEVVADVNPVSQFMDS